MQLFLSPQRNPSTTIIWLITRVCDLFSCPMKLDTFFQDNICGSLSITQQSLNEELFKLFKHTSEGERDGTLVCFLSKRNARNGETSKKETKNRNLCKMEYELPMSFNNSRLGKFSSHYFVFDPGASYNKHMCFDGKQNIIITNMFDYAFDTCKKKDIMFNASNVHFNHMFFEENHQLKLYACLLSNLKFKLIRTLFLLLFDDNHIFTSLHLISLIKRGDMASLVVSNDFNELLQKIKQNGQNGRLKPMESQRNEPGRLKTEKYILLARLIFRKFSTLILRGNVEEQKSNKHDTRRLEEQGSMETTKEELMLLQVENHVIGGINMLSIYQGRNSCFGGALFCWL
ncbi:PREDICTED: uncharacterized protein LOC104807991 isoform X1 [Tarenaya hassleriana]|uniref:uncharacterized protein LOC104807991 isoform X1 n=1 Tax=Tarenaya hassleriana TaxID=28532 RepID=UPI0008FD9213|nr:PREDICTED: uncharacterized protein LOC104807991 isoform X1 [Tarenaya hassleriana]XP_019057467.1 PREDICTED: uncharacterized protein LOC104807991 isoform X1 [Tarenaya hassleriana]XP_019057468.1 PREDICTED: uncharacterized protein LOC104807991 isoform X1 [Tarenaya hassleriana]